MPATDSHPLLPHKTGGQAGYSQALQSTAAAPGNEFTLLWFRGREVLRPPTVSFDPDMEIARVIKAWLLLGGIGRRANRAAGSVWPFTSRPLSIADFKNQVASIGLPDSVEVWVCNAPAPALLTAWAIHPQLKAELAGNSAAQLRAIASDTIRGTPNPGSIRGMIVPDGLGYVEGANRKASPLKLKIGHFQEGHRLIAVWDNRNGRGGILANVITALTAAAKPLGALLNTTTPQAPTRIHP